MSDPRAEPAPDSERQNARPDVIPGTVTLIGRGQVHVFAHAEAGIGAARCFGAAPSAFRDSARGLVPAR